MADNPNPWIVNPDQVDESKLLPIGPPVIPGQGPAGAPPMPEAGGRGAYFAGTTAPQLGHDSTFVASMGTSPMIPRTSLMPLAPSAQAAVNAAAQTIATQVVNKAIAAIPPAATTVTDGLIHGDTIWAIDPAVVQLRDDFIGATNSQSAPFGELGWFASGNFNTLEKRFGAPPYLGQLSITNTAVANDCILFTFLNGGPGSANNVDNLMALLDYPSWKIVFVFGFDYRNPIAASAFSITQKSLYVGLMSSSVAPLNSRRPPIFIGVRYDTDTTAPAISDTTFVLEVVTNESAGTRNNTQGTTHNTGVTPLAGVMHRLEIQCVAAGVVTMSFDGAASVNFNVPQYVAGSTSSGGGSIATGLPTNTTRCTPAGGGALVANAFANGSKVTIAGSSTSANNGARTLVQSTFQGSVSYPTQAGEVNDAASNISITGFPGYYFFWLFGNDTQAAPTVNTCALCMDFFSFVWNPGVGGGTVTSDATKSRYF